MRASIPLALPLALVLALCACGPHGAGDVVHEAPFSFAVLADTHIASDVSREERLAALVAWLNGEAAARRIELVLVVGDIGWGAGVEKAAAALDQLTMPYVPIIGDNEIHNGLEADFERVYAPRLLHLAQTLPGWSRAPSPVANPETGAQSWLQNYSFDWRGLHFVALDFCDRANADGIASEVGYAHDFPGGTWPWFVAELEKHRGAPRDSVVLVSHLPMHDVGLNEEAMAKVRATLPPFADQVYAALAGHVHVAYDVMVDELYRVYVSPAAFADPPKVRIFDVQQVAGGFEITQALVPVSL